MNGWCKFKIDNEKETILGYSFGDNRTCDGEMRLDKATKELKVLRSSEGETVGLVKQFYCLARGKIRSGFELDKLYYLASG